MGDELGERQERMGALEAREEDRRYQKKDDFKICLQKTALISVNPALHHIIFYFLCFYPFVPPVIRPHLTQMDSRKKMIKPLIKTRLIFLELHLLCSSSQFKLFYFLYVRASFLSLVVPHKLNSRWVELRVHTQTILVCESSKNTEAESRDYWHRH